MLVENVGIPIFSIPKSSFWSQLLSLGFIHIYRISGNNNTFQSCLLKTNSLLRNQLDWNSQMMSGWERAASICISARCLIAQVDSKQWNNKEGTF